MSQQLSAGVSLALAQRGGGGQPSLALNFLTEQLDSRITFSRGTQAMRYGQDGTLQYAPNNLLTYSNQADNAAWTKSNSFVQTNLATYSQDFDLWSLGAGVTVNTNTTIAPDGTLTADRVNFATGGAPDFVRKALALTVGVTYTISVYAISTGGSPTFYFDVGNGGVVQSPNQTPTSTWQRFSYTFVFAGVNQWVDIEASAPGSIVFWGGQIVQGSVPGDYRATTSAALPVLYADYNGNLRARKLCETAITGTHNITQNATVVGSAIYTDSIYVKAGERTSCRVINYDNGANYAWIYVDLTNGNTLNSGVTGTVSNQSFTVTSAGLGWYRISVVAGLAATTRQFRIDTAVGASENTTGDGSSGIYIVDAQLTPGYLPLAVTETTSAAVYGPRLDYDPSSLVTQNLLTYSNTFDNAIWVKNSATVTPNAAVSPDGTNNAWLLSCVTVAGGRITQIATALTATNTFSGYAKAGNVSAITVLMYNVTTSAIIAQADVNLITGAVTNLTGTCVTASSVSGWWRFALTNSSGVTSGNIINCYFYSGLSSAAVGSNIYIYGGQLNQGSTALPYAATTSATVQTCAARGLQLEEQRTNLLTFSNTFSDASWLAISAKNVAASAVLSPEGVANAWTLTDSSAVAYEGIQKSVTVAADSATYAASLYVLKTYGGTSTTFGVNLQITGGTTVANNIRINTDTGGVLNGAVTVTNAGLWWRVAGTITNNASVGNTTLNVSIYPATAAYNSGTDAVGTTGSATIYQAQLEAGSKATSPIITQGSTATRNGESETIAALASWYNTAAGTWYVEADTDTYPRYLVMDAAGGAKYPMYLHSIAGGVATYDGTTTVVTANATVAGTTFKASTAYGAGTMSSVLNGGTVASGAYSGSFSTIATFLFGNSQVSGVAGSGNINGHLRAIKYWRRKFSATEQQRITA